MIGEVGVTAGMALGPFMGGTLYQVTATNNKFVINL